MDKEKKIVSLIKGNPFISQNELASQLGLSRSAVAGYISQLVKKGKIVGRAYIMPKEAHVTCIGGANVDRKAQSLNPLQLRESNPAEVTLSSGGVARNIAESLGRLGCSTSLITLVGDDSEGKWLLDETKQHGVDVSQAFRMPSGRTGTYTAVLDENGDMVVAFADMQIYDSLTSEMLQTKWPHIASSELVLMDTNVSSELLRYVIERCNVEQLSLCINTVSAVKAMKLPEVLIGVDVMVSNKNEAEVLTNMKIETIADCKLACERMMQRGVKRAVVTLGEQGLIWTDQEESGHLLPPKVEVIDVTGAGDALMAGLVFGLIQGEPLARACRLGMIAASLTLQTKQTVSSLTADQLYSLL